MAERNLGEDIQKLNRRIESLGSLGTPLDSGARIADIVKRRIPEESIMEVLRDAMQRARLEGILFGLRYANKEEADLTR